MDTTFSEHELYACGMTRFGMISTDKICFGTEIRKICEGNGCGNYGKTWACPPGVGTLEECMAEVRSYKNALVFCRVYTLEDSFDFEGMEEGHRDFKAICDRLYGLVKGRIGKFRLLSNEGCIRCKKCAYPDAPCRFPEKLFPSLEGYGIYVNQLAQSAGMKYINGPDTVTYFGMLLYGT